MNGLIFKVLPFDSKTNEFNPRKTGNTCMNDESSSSSRSKSSIFSRMWVASVLVLLLEEEETPSVSFCSTNLDPNNLGGF